jgi:Flp pilus assembly protein TadB
MMKKKNKKRLMKRTKLKKEEIRSEVRSAKTRLEKIEIRKEDIITFGKKKKKNYMNYVYRFLIALVLWTVVFFLTDKWVYITLCIVLFIFLFEFYFYAKRKLKISENLRKMEDVFPDFISLMASNLRAGMTIDQAMLTSSRDEFAPLDKQIVQVGKDIITGKKINVALEDMAKRIKSDKIKKTVNLITSGIRAGGNLSILLEETASNMRERAFVEKRAASNVLMYVIFIFFAVSIGAPLLFGMSTVLVEILTNIMSSLPTDQTTVNLPFALTKINISVNFVIYFSLVFLVVTDILASLVLGLVSKGDEKEGFRYTIPLIICSLSVFFISRIVLSRYFVNVFG